MTPLEKRLEKFKKSGTDIYKRMYSVWENNRDRCTDLLKGVEIHYPFFSLHDASHSKKVIRNIEMLLGDRVKKLSATDTWLILHTAFMHDLGMIIPDEEYRSVWNRQEFQDYLRSRQESPVADIREAANFLRNLPREAGKEENWPQNWPVEVYFSSSLLISDYFRPSHAERIKPYLEDGPQNRGISFANINHRGMVELIEKIAGLHTSDFRAVLDDLDYEVMGLGDSKDKAHPRFVAELLRIGDVLDLDNNRFPYDLQYLRGKLPESSDVHRRLHFATTKLNIRPEEVTYTANCKDYNTYNQVKQLTEYIKEEFKNFAYYWDKIVPDKFPFPPPRFNFSDSDILINGKKDIDNRAGLRFTLMESKAFQLLEGANIYHDEMTPVRELLQNALDATKIQFWTDLQDPFYQEGLPKDVPLHELQPYHIPADRFSKNPYLQTVPKAPNRIWNFPCVISGKRA